MTTDNSLFPAPYFSSGMGSPIATVGCDPEFFFEDEDGRIIPAFSVLQSQAAAPAEYPYFDGWQGEFGTNPTHCIAYMVDGIHDRLQKAARAIGKKGRISVYSVLDVDLVRLIEHPEHAQFGCTPSLSAYDSQPEMAHDGFSVPFRMAGGHIHLGISPRHLHLFGPDDEDNRRTVVKFLDRTAGLIGTALFAEVEDARRRLLYGRAGEYRAPKYGIEYRVPSNAWMLHPVLAHFYVGVVRRAAACAVVDIVAGRNPLDRLPMNDEEVQIAINESEVGIARTLIQSYMPFFEQLITYSACHFHEAVAMFNGAVMNTGVRAILPDNYSLSAAWKIDGDTWSKHSASVNACVASGLAAIKDTGKLGIGDT